MSEEHIVISEDGAFIRICQYPDHPEGVRYILGHASLRHNELMTRLNAAHEHALKCLGIGGHTVSS